MVLAGERPAGRRQPQIPPARTIKLIDGDHHLFAKGAVGGDEVGIHDWCIAVNSAAWRLTTTA
jgi:hypothetical protein